MSLSKHELIELLYELPAELPYNPRPVNVEKFVAEVESREIPFSDIAYFIEWEPMMVHHIERCFNPLGHVVIFPTWDAYLAAGFDFYEGDPYQPLDATATYDAGLSGVWYTSLL